MKSLRPPTWAVMISGRGSNLQAQLDLLSQVNLRWVISSKSSAAGILRARRHGIPVTVLPKKIDWVDLDRQLQQRRITHLFLAGFMKLIPESFVEKWQGRILNVHPSLLPAFPGLEAIEKSHAAGAPMGVTVHVVTPEMDAGPKLFQGAISTTGLDWQRVTLDQSALRISRLEQRLVREGILRWR